MVDYKKVTLGILAILISISIVYITFNNDLKMRIDEDKSTFYVKNDANRWVVAGREYNKLMDGSSNMYRDRRGITLETLVNNLTNTTTIIRTTPYQRGPVIKDTYFFDGKVTDKELFPIYHKVEVYNATGYYYRYEVRDLTYDGPTFKLDGNQTMQEFGRNMKVTWWDDYRLGWVYKSGSMYVKSEKITSDYVSFNVRLFDPPPLPTATGSIATARIYNTTVFETGGAGLAKYPIFGQKFVETNDGNLYMVTLNNADSMLYCLNSSDGGTTWSSTDITSILPSGAGLWFYPTVVSNGTRLVFIFEHGNPTNNLSSAYSDTGCNATQINDTFTYVSDEDTAINDQLYDVVYDDVNKRYVVTKTSYDSGNLTVYNTSDLTSWDKYVITPSNKTVTNLAVDTSGRMLTLIHNSTSATYDGFTVVYASDDLRTWDVILNVTLSDSPVLGYPSVSVNPYNNDYYVAGIQGIGTTNDNLTVYRSTDNGTTWTNYTFASSSTYEGNISRFSGFKMVFYDEYRVFLPYGKFNSDTMIYLAYSSNRGVTWDVDSLVVNGTGYTLPVAFNGRQSMWPVSNRFTNFSKLDFKFITDGVPINEYYEQTQINVSPFWTTALPNQTVSTYDPVLFSNLSDYVDDGGTGSITFSVEEENVYQVDCVISTNELSVRVWPGFRGLASCTIGTNNSQFDGDNYTIYINSTYDPFVEANLTTESVGVTVQAGGSTVAGNRMVKTNDGNLYLFYPYASSGDLMCANSSDGGQTWTTTEMVDFSVYEVSYVRAATNGSRIVVVASDTTSPPGPYLISFKTDTGCNATEFTTYNRTIPLTPFYHGLEYDGTRDQYIRCYADYVDGSGNLTFANSTNGINWTTKVIDTKAGALGWFECDIDVNTKGEIVMFANDISDELITFASDDFFTTWTNETFTPENTPAVGNVFADYNTDYFYFTYFTSDRINMSFYRSRDGGVTWEERTKIPGVFQKTPQSTYDSTPGGMWTNDDKIIHIFSQQNTGSGSQSAVFYTSTFDQGLTWTQPHVVDAASGSFGTAYPSAMYANFPTEMRGELSREINIQYVNHSPFTMVAAIYNLTAIDEFTLPRLYPETIYTNNSLYLYCEPSVYNRSTNITRLDYDVYKNGVSILSGNRTPEENYTEGELITTVQGGLTYYPQVVENSDGDLTYVTTYYNGTGLGVYIYLCDKWGQDCTRRLVEGNASAYLPINIGGGDSLVSLSGGGYAMIYEYDSNSAFGLAVCDRKGENCQRTQLADNGDVGTYASMMQHSNGDIIVSGGTSTTYGTFWVCDSTGVTCTAKNFTTGEGGYRSDIREMSDGNITVSYVASAACKVRQCNATGDSCTSATTIDSSNCDYAKFVNKESGDDIDVVTGDSNQDRLQIYLCDSTGASCTYRILAQYTDPCSMTYRDSFTTSRGDIITSIIPTCVSDTLQHVICNSTGQDCVIRNITTGLASSTRVWSAIETSSEIIVTAPSKTSNPGYLYFTNPYTYSRGEEYFMIEVGSGNFSKGDNLTGSCRANSTDGTLTSWFNTSVLTVSNLAPYWLYDLPNQTVLENSGTTTVLNNLSSYANDLDSDTIIFSVVDENTSKVDCTIIEQICSDWPINNCTFNNSYQSLSPPIWWTQNMSVEQNGTAYGFTWFSSNSEWNETLYFCRDSDFDWICDSGNGVYDVSGEGYTNDAGGVWHTFYFNETLEITTAPMQILMVGKGDIETKGGNGNTYGATALCIALSGTQPINLSCTPNFAPYRGAILYTPEELSVTPATNWSGNSNCTVNIQEISGADGGNKTFWTTVTEIPFIDSVTIEPDPAYANDTLQGYCNYTYSDSDANGTLYYKWYRNNQELSSGSTSKGFCYQESFNTTNQSGTDGSCGLDYSGSIDFDTEPSDAWKGIDGNYGTYVVLGYAEADIVYKKPQDAISAIWQFTSRPAYGVIVNQTIPDACWDYSPDNITLHVYYADAPSTDSFGNYTCWDGSSWVEIYSLTDRGAGSFGEEGIYWYTASRPNITYNVANLSSDNFDVGTQIILSCLAQVNPNSTWKNSSTLTISSLAPLWLYSLPNQTVTEDSGTTLYLNNLSDYAYDPDGQRVVFSIQDENTSQVNCNIESKDTLTDINTTLDYAGVNITNIANAFDGNWNSYASTSNTGGGYAYIYHNISMNDTTTNATVTYKFQIDSGSAPFFMNFSAQCYNFTAINYSTFNLTQGSVTCAASACTHTNTIPDDCLKGDNLRLRYETYSNNDRKWRVYESNYTITDTTYNLSGTPAANWNGLANCTVGINDSSTWGENRTFFINVTSVPDAPIFDPALENKSTNSSPPDVYFYYDINCTDPDGGNVTYASNTTWLPINSTTGVINTTVNDTFVGNNSIQITCTDTGGLSTNGTFVLLVNDTSPPEVTLLLPTNGGRQVGTTTEVAYSPYDGSGVANCSLYINQALNQTDTSITNGGNNYFTIDVTQGSTYNWSVNCTDPLGNRNSSVTWNFTVNTPPPATNLLTPADGAFVGGDLTQLTWNTSITDPDGDTLTYYVWFGTTAVPPYYSNTQQGNLNVLTTSEGTYYWYVKVYDGYEYSAATPTWDFQRTFQSLTLEIQTPVLAYTNETEILFNVSAVGDNATLDSGKLNLNGSVYYVLDYNKVNDTLVYFYRNVTGLTEGNYSYFFSVKNDFNVESITPTQYIYVDLSFPGVSFIAPTPANGSFWNKSVNGTNVTINTSIVEPLPDDKRLYWYKIENGVIVSTKTKVLTADDYVLFEPDGSSFNKYQVCVEDVFSRRNCTENRTIYVYPKTAPYLSSSIPNQTTYKNVNLTSAFDLDDYFIDPNKWTLTYTSREGDNVTITINSDNTVDIGLDNNFVGTSWVIFNATDPAGQSVESNNVTITVADPYPEYSNPTESSDPVYYENAFNLSIDWTTNGGTMDTVILEVNWTGTLTNFTVTNVSDTYSYELNTTDYGVGTMYYRWYANNSFSNSNQTGWYNITLAKFQTVITMTLNGASANLTIITPTTVEINGSITCVYCTQNLTLYNDTGDLLANQASPLSYSELVNISIGENITYTINFTGNANYTAANQSYTVFMTDNQAPVWSTIPNQTLKRGHKLIVNLSQYVTDPEGDPVNYSVSAQNLEQVACDINTTNGNVTLWGMVNQTTNQTWYGNATCTIVATDVGGSSSTTLNIEVNSTGYVVIGNFLDNYAGFWNITTVVNRNINLSCIAWDTYDFSRWKYE